MSVWTHVIGTFTIYDIPKDRNSLWRKKILKRLYKNMGKPSRCLEINNTIVPEGSEGSLHWTIQEVNLSGDIPLRYRDTTVAKWLQNNRRYGYVISIFGDLRDYENLQEIREWFENIIYEPSYNVQDGFLKADCGQETMNISYDWAEKYERNKEFNKIMEKWL